MKKNKYIIMLSTLLLVLVLIIIILIINITNKRTFHKPPFDKNTTTEIPNELDYKDSIIKVSEGYSLYIDGIPTIKNNELIINLITLKENNVWIKIRVLNDEEKIIAESGLIRPGEYLRSVETIKKISKNDKLTYMIMGYEIDTYLSAGNVALNTKAGG